MNDYFVNISQDIIDFIKASGPFLGPLIGFSLVILESIIPALPLAVFIAINVFSFGNVVGFIISYIATILGCLLSYFVFYKLGEYKYFKNFKKKKDVKKIINYIEKAPVQKITLLMALPFSPAFAINIAGGFSEVPFKRFLIALIISKQFIIYFWGYIGKSFVESLNDPLILIKISIMLLLAYLISKTVSKKLNI